MVTQKPDVDSFTQFAVANEAKLRHALIAACGGERGREVAVEALTYGWEHWDRLQTMDNPVGYLYVVGRKLGRQRRRSVPMFTDAPVDRTPDIEPKLPQALAALSERQRTAVVLVHCFQWTLHEVSELMGVLVLTLVVAIRVVRPGGRHTETLGDPDSCGWVVSARSESDMARVHLAAN